MDHAARQSQRTYDAAADRYDELGFWARLGERTVARLDLPEGARVLDVPCGSGASALPAARAVGPAGSVLGVDVSAGLLALARAKAERAELAGARFAAGDMRALGHPDGAFDAVLSVFGIFFAPDMVALARELWRMVAPGGVLAVTTWGADAFEPGASAFWEAVGDVRRELVRGFEPWDRVGTPAAAAALLRDAGIAGTSELEDSDEPVPGAAGWWAILLGTGYRATIDALAPGERAHVEAQVRGALAHGPPMRSPAVFAAARRPF